MSMVIRKRNEREGRKRRDYKKMKLGRKETKRDKERDRKEKEREWKERWYT